MVVNDAGKKKPTSITVPLRGAIRIKALWHKFHYMRLGNKMNVYVAPFVVGLGFRFFPLCRLHTYWRAGKGW